MIFDASKQPYNEKYFFPERKTGDKFQGPQETLLVKQWKIVISGFFSVFIIYILLLYYLGNYDNVFIYIFRANNIKLNCYNIDSSLQPTWLTTTRLFIVGASFSAVCSNIIRTALAVSKSGHNNNVLSAFISGTLVMTMSFLGEAIQLSGMFTNVCIDAFGVKSPLIEISEWLVTVPMMIYLNITIDFKKQKLDSKDYSVLASAYLMIVFGFLPIICNQTLSAISFLISGSFFCYFTFTVLIDSFKAVGEFYKEENIKAEDLYNYIEFTFAKKRMYTALMIALIFPAFPMTYLLRASGVITSEFSEATFSFLNFASKCCFVLALMEDQLDVVDPKIMKLLFERKNNAEATRSLQQEIQLNKRILKYSYPPRVVEDLRNKITTKNLHHDSVTVFYSEIEGFADIETKLGPSALIGVLNQLHSVIDYCASLFPTTHKIETDKEGYMLVSGVNDDAVDRDNATHIANFAILVQSVATIIRHPVTSRPLKLKIGIHSGPVDSGMIGSRRFNVYGKTLDEAKLLAKFGDFNKIHCSEVTAALLQVTGLFELSKSQYLKMKTDVLKLKCNTVFIEGSTETNEVSNVDATANVRSNARQILSSVDNAIHQSKLRDKYLITPSINAAEKDKIKEKIKIDYRSFKILLIGNVAMYQKVLISTVPTFQIVTATNAEDAIETLKANSNFDLIFVNESLSLDGYRGSEFVDYVRKNISIDHCVIIGIGSKGGKSHVQAVNFIKAGADVFYESLEADLKELFTLWLKRNLEINKQLEISTVDISRTATVNEICAFVGF